MRLPLCTKQKARKGERVLETEQRSKSNSYATMRQAAVIDVQSKPRKEKREQDTKQR
jgi:hypothetical protein